MLQDDFDCTKTGLVSACLLDKLYGVNRSSLALNSTT